MALRLYNTLAKKVENFTPIMAGRVGLYTCGPTVYQFAHVGNLRTYLFEDVLRRVLAFNGLEVQHVMNITDVGHLTDDADDGEDKVEAAAAKERRSAHDITAFYTKVFLHDLADLNILPPHVMPKATEHIEEQIALIQQLEINGYTYETKDGVYFDTAKLPDYGKLATQKARTLIEGARVEKNPEKRNPTDFALWKFSPKESKRQMEWASPWGVGFPGWHIECSAMSMKYLGRTFDIHTGGVDHIAVHHTNEIAQSEGATGAPLARYWLHGEFLVLDTGRMGKSEGNAMTLTDLKQRNYAPLAYRYLCLNTHYRKRLLFSWESLDAAQSAFTSLVDRVRLMPKPKIGCAEFEGRFRDAINDDLNTPKALGILWELLKSDYPGAAKHRTLLMMDEVFGLGLATVKPLKVPKKIHKLAEEREEARKAKDFEKADLLRAEIEKSGFSVEDSSEGPLLREKR